ncbi:hypothetical protein TWF694_003998 [Orbilia ellipsospora]|uniref:A to I editase domain-containing protein n=1 Tax=Orbilia ellipsospora TaxID=2528407 RepID=A0AAV9WY21_9PEZI
MYRIYIVIYSSVLISIKTLPIGRTVPPSLRLASLATGSKCLPANLLPKASGLILHDSHSEILALRGLNRFLLQEAKDLLLPLSPDSASSFLLHDKNYTRTGGGDNDGSPVDQPFQLDPSISIHLFSTEPPCGDASMEFIMSAQQDATPWSPPPNASDTPQSLPGRSYFSSLSVVRRKPSRPDAPPTLSKSCTDKLTLKQFTSVLSSLSSLFISPSSNAYISTFTLPHDKYHPEGYTRAFTHSGRLSKIDTTAKQGSYSFSPFKVTPLSPNSPVIPSYPYPKPPLKDTNTKTSNISVLYINSRNPVIEVLISGVKQGNGQLSNSHDGRKGSVVCRKKMWQLGREIAEVLGNQTLVTTLNSQSYGDMKTLEGHRSNMKNIVIDALGGWEKNFGDDGWTL